MIMGVVSVIIELVLRAEEVIMTNKDNIIPSRHRRVDII